MGTMERRNAWAQALLFLWSLIAFGMVLIFIPILHASLGYTIGFLVFACLGLNLQCGLSRHERRLYVAL